MQVTHALLLASSLILAACGPAPAVTTDDGDEASETDADTGETTGDSAFLSKLDTVPVSECDPFQQNCPPGEKCAPYARHGGNWDATKCVPVKGDRAPGEPCIYGGASEGTDDCDASGMCWNTTETHGELLGTCVSFCQGSPDDPVCPEGYFCPISAEGTINLCLATCDPVAQDCAHAGEACFWSDSMFLCTPTTRDIPVGQPCGFINDCAGGLTCLTAEILPNCVASACCAAFCDLELGDAQCDAAPGTACMSFWEGGTTPPEHAHVGICILP